MAAFFTAGTAADVSTTFVVGATEYVGLVLTPAAVPIDAAIDIEQQLANAEWQPVGRMSALMRARVVQAPGTYRLRRFVCSAPVGVDKN